MMLYKNMKAIVCSCNEDTDFFDIVPGVLQGDALVSYLFMLYLNYILQTSIDLVKENGFTLKKKTRSRQYATQTMTDTDYTDDLSLLANAPVQANCIA